VTDKRIEAKDSLEAGRMKSWIGGVALRAMALMSAGATVAQETSTNRVNAITDWSVFEGQEPRECWAVTTYKESVNTRG